MAGFLQLPPYSFRDGKEFLPASLLFALHATLSLFALHGMNIPMYGAIKRCTPLVSLILSVIVLRKAVPSKPIVLSILLITFGCLIASIGDLEFDGHAYFMGLLSVFAQGGYLTLVQRSSTEMKKSTLEMIHINGFNTLPFFAIISMVILEPVNIAESNSFFGKVSNTKILFYDNSFYCCIYRGWIFIGVCDTCALRMHSNFFSILMRFCVFSRYSFIGRCG